MDTSISQSTLDDLFPSDIADKFFEALYGEAEEGAYDIRLVLRTASPTCLQLAFELHQRPGKCLACNLTHGLPQVFQRHPLINVAGLSKQLAKAAGWQCEAPVWHLGRTEEPSPALHCIPLEIRSI